MMKYKMKIYVAISSIIIAILILSLSFYMSSILLMILGILMVVVSAIYAIIIMSVEIFSKDKEIDIENAIKQGLTVINCSECGKTNVLEDVYCIYCGEDLRQKKYLSGLCLYCDAKF